ncbi:MAG: 16S rRNA (guanine(966)-N(2))-methyltransferase RsmD [Candidatus Saccharimonadia bacterium]
MRIIGGEFGGRVILRPKTALTRPMTDKVRESLFNIVGDLTDWEVADLYAGSGAIGLEAISRGAKHVVFVESAKEALRIISQNIGALEVNSQSTLFSGTVTKYAQQFPAQRFNLAIADPPYEKINVRELNLLSHLVAPKGLFIISHSSRILAPKLESIERIETRTYGDSSLSFYDRD